MKEKTRLERRTLSPWSLLFHLLLTFMRGAKVSWVWKRSKRPSLTSHKQKKMTKEKLGSEKIPDYLSNDAGLIEVLGIY